MLVVAPDVRSVGPVDVPAMVGRTLNQQDRSTVCQTVDCIGHRAPLLGRIRCTEKAVKIFWLDRTTGTGQKCLQQVDEPGDSELWVGRECVIVLAHSGRSDRAGHWFTFIKANDIWWRSDTSLPGLRQENPFLSQLLPSSPPSSSDYTINIIMFK